MYAFQLLRLSFAKKSFTQQFETISLQNSSKVNVIPRSVLFALLIFAMEMIRIAFWTCPFKKILQFLLQLQKNLFSFKSSINEKSYVSMMSIGYILGFPNKSHGFFMAPAKWLWSQSCVRLIEGLIWYPKANLRKYLMLSDDT